jgi:hypothetical protein
MCRPNKEPSKECSAIVSEREDMQCLDTNIVNMNPESLNFWLCKFIQEVCKADGEKYPPRTLYSIVCGLQRHLDEANIGESISLL